MYGWLSRAHATLTSAISNCADSVSSLNSMAASASANGNGEVRIVRLRREHRLQVQVVALARVDGHLVAALVERREERQPLDVIPVGVADEQVDARVAGLAFGQLLAQLADPGAGVDDDTRSRRRADLDARGVAAITFGLGPRHGKRPANAPEADPHDRGVREGAPGARPTRGNMADRISRPGLLRVFSQVLAGGGSRRRAIEIVPGQLAQPQGEGRELARL